MWAPFCDDYTINVPKKENPIQEVNQFYTNGIWKITDVYPDPHRVGRHGVFVNEIRVNAPLIMIYVNYERGKVDEMFGKFLRTSQIEKIRVMKRDDGEVYSIQVSTINSQYVLDRVY